MEGRLELHNVLKSLTTNVYYEPADGQQLTYPCIVYNRQNLDNKRANNANLYVGNINYNVTYMSRNGGVTMMKNLLKALPSASLINIMTIQGIYHETYSIYFRL